ncbi:hypothetical protein [Streptomyces malaysiensis]|uniref:hypothetical protein n=1 Tax=Streptomyces malaysiensis TaxID=92644 RepID=UPI0036752F76
MEAIADRIQAAAKKRNRAKEAFDRADAELRDLLVEGRAGGIGPSELSRLTGFTREWVAKIAPDPRRQAAIQRRLDENAAKNASES